MGRPAIGHGVWSNHREVISGVTNNKWRRRLASILPKWSSSSSSLSGKSDHDDTYLNGSISVLCIWRSCWSAEKRSNAQREEQGLTALVAIGHPQTIVNIKIHNHVLRGGKTILKFCLKNKRVFHVRLVDWFSSFEPFPALASSPLTLMWDHNH